MNDAQLLRYARHLLLDDVGDSGQDTLLSSHALVLGAGGLGCSAALFLAASGVGTLTLVDHDNVDLTNLQRQIGHSTARIGMQKVESLRMAIHELNPDIDVHLCAERATQDSLPALLKNCDIALDCSDNFATRHLLNQHCFQLGIPLVSGAIIRMDGQLTTFDPRQPHSPCYACVFPPQHAPAQTQCATLGVLAPLVGVIGSMQAAEALKVLMGIGSSLVGRLQLLEGKHLQWSEIRIQADPLCCVCSPHKVRV